MGNLRITGLATGLDVDSIVKQLMKAENIKVDKLKQDKQLVQWRQDLYRDIISSLKNFKDTYLDILSGSNVISTSKLTPYTVNMSSNDVVSVAATATARPGNYEVIVDQVATKARLTSTEIGGLNASISGTIDIEVNGVSKSITGFTNYKEFIDKFNTEFSGKARAYYSEVTDKIYFETLQTGSSNEIKITDSDIATIGVGNVTGTNSSIRLKIDGEAGFTVIEKSSNSFNVDGLTFTLNKASAETYKFSVGVDSKPVIDKVKEFIGKYNELIDKINTKLNEKRAYSYKPLTDEQKSAMKEDEIKKWEEKAKEGLLAGDIVLQNIVTNMRQAFSQKVDGVNITLTEIGLSTSMDYTQRGKIIIDENKLKSALENKPEEVIKLLTNTSTIAYDPNKTYQSRVDRNKELGIFNRLKDIIDDNIRLTRNNSGKKGLLIEKAGLKGDISEYRNTLSEELNRKEKQIQDLLARLTDKENKYYRQFSKLESAMQKYNDQMSWLTTRIGGMFK